MTQNLRLTGSDTPLTQEDSQVSSAGFSMPTSAENTGTWCTENSSACDDQTQYLNSNDDTYGVYYNWYTATAGSGTYSTSSGNASYSICPKGWRLPTNAEFTNLISKYNASSQGSNLVTGDPKMQYGGYCDPGSNACGSSSGSRGYYWSSTVSSFYSYNLYFYSTSARTGSDGRTAGFSVRCVFGS